MSLLTEFSEHTLWITLNRPEASNAFDDEMISRLVEELYQAEQNSEVWTIVITGAGKHFCAGGDVKSMSEKSGMFAGEPNELRRRYQFGIQQIPLAMNSLSKPVIAMVNGAAIGAGLDLACMCDIRVASEHAKFGETFAKLGLIPGDGGSFFLQRVIGFARAMELTLTAEIIGAEKALELNLVNYVVGANDIKSKTKKIIDKIHANAPIAVQMAKRSLVHSYRNDLNSVLDLLSAYQGITQRTSDHFEALKNLKSGDKTDFKSV
ncbi:MAG: 3-hxdroxyacyl-CoA dehydrogenase [Halobacteriovoraceae bacterium]|nr:3-hxdroxyacyl-CoA dehydrogenase [Halobacteriovoraceae bacterium]|tara:strand:- start:5229 stop:6020 length:792 start_codon:yes stop_codon:yes gene_type:complete